MKKNTCRMAFGLFCVDLPAGMTPGPIGCDGLTDLCCELGPGQMLHANYAPQKRYQDTAGKKLNGYVSFLYALCGENSSETAVMEEMLDNGTALRWRFLRGSRMHVLCFEAFTEAFGYNMILTGDASEVQDQVLLEIMRSFRTDRELERNRLEIRQQKSPDGAFISAEHGLQLQLEEGWQPVVHPELLLPETAFMLEKDGGRRLIQLLYTHRFPSGDARSLLEWYVKLRGGSVNSSHVINLEHLGVEAWTAVENAGVTMQHIALIHEGFGYYGSFMWVRDDEPEARSSMERAMLSLCRPEC